jgi:ABC-type microcin C transport system duplicated ATPase subunit YejF
MKRILYTIIIASMVFAINSCVEDEIFVGSVIKISETGHLMENEIIIRGAREHNLKNINLNLPRDKFIVFTGISGSGKSTLAFDTIFAEGQRRYLESLSRKCFRHSLTSTAG